MKLEGPEKCFAEAAELFEDAYLRLESLEQSSQNPNRLALLKLAKQNKVVASLISKLPQVKFYFLRWCFATRGALSIFCIS